MRLLVVLVAAACFHLGSTSLRISISSTSMDATVRFLVSIFEGPLSDYTPVIVHNSNVPSAAIASQVSSMLSYPVATMSATTRNIDKYFDLSKIRFICFVLLVDDASIRNLVLSLTDQNNKHYAKFLIVLDTQIKLDAEDEDTQDYYEEDDRIYSLLEGIGLKNVYYMTKKKTPLTSGEVLSLYYRPYECMDKKSSLIGQWRRNQVIFLHKIPRFFRNFKGCTFTATVLDSPPNVRITQKYDNLSVTASGYEITMVKEVANVLNFDTKFITPPKRIWGTKINGTWRGLIGGVYYGKADIAICLLSATYTRYEAVDYSIPFTKDGFVFVLAKPRPLSKWKIVLSIFSALIWAATLVSIAVSVSAMYLMSKLFIRILKDQDKFFREGQVWSRSIENNIFYCVSTCLMRNPFEAGRLSSWRMVTAAWMLGSLILAWAYQSQLISYFTIIEFQKVPHSLEEVIQQHYKISKYFSGSHADNAIMYSSDPVMAKLRKVIKWRSLEDPNDVFPETAMREASKPKEAYFSSEKRLSQDLLLYSDFNLQMGDSIYFLTHICWPVAKGSGLKGSLDWRLRMLLESGLIKKWNDDFLLDYVRERTGKTVFDLNAFPTEGVTVLTLSHIQSSFYLLFLGLIVGGVILITELLWKRIPAYCKK